MARHDTLAAVDLGSNSFHLQIGRVVDGQIYPLDSVREVVRLGGGLTADKRIDRATQAAALEALVHAVESDRLRLSRIEDALKRQQRAKERFLAAAVATRPPAARTLRSALGRDEHRAIADEMSRFL